VAQPRIVVILPTLNEEPTIAGVIDEIPRSALEQAGYGVQVLVVDGNSTDRSRQTAERKGARVIIEPRKGKGTAVTGALGVVEADFIFMLDADGTYSPGYIPEMLRLLESRDAVVGSRLRGRRERGAMSRLNLVGNHLLSWLASLLYGRRISDVCSGFWGFRGAVLKGLSLKATAFDLEAEIFSRLVGGGYTLAELPVSYRRRADRAKLRPWRDGVKIGWALLARRFLRAGD